MAAATTVAPEGDHRVAPAAAPGGGRGWRNWPVTDRFWPAVAGAVAVGFLLRLAIGLTDDAPASDETAYLNSGISLLDGQGFTRAGHPELHFPPFVPFVLGVAHRLIGDAHTASVVITILFGTAAIVPLALVARRVAGARLGRRAGVAAAWIAAVLPGLATMPATRGTGSEAVYLFVVATAMCLALAAARTRPARTHLALAAGAGLLVGLAYLTRPEGLFVAVPLGIAVLWPGLAARREAGLRPVVATAGVFVVPLVLCVVPYVSFLHTNTGEWGLTGKTQDASIEAWHAVARGDRLTRDSILYALDETGLHFEDERSSLAALALEDPSGYAAILRTNLGELGTTAVGWTLVPLPVTALAAWGAWQRRRSGATAVVLTVGALPVVTSLAMFFVQARYLVMAVAAVTVLAGVGLACVSARWRPWAAAGVLGLCVFGSVQAFHGAAGWGRPADFTDQRLAGEWLADNAEPGARVVTRSMVVDFYAERPTVALPYASLDEVLRFSRHYGARYLVADDAHIGRFRPQLAALLEGGEVEGLRMVHEVTAEGRTTRVYELDPVPPAPEGDDGAPALGFMGDG